MDGLTTIDPPPGWGRRGFLISIAYLAVVLTIGFHVPVFFILVPFALYHVVFCWFGMHAGSLRIELYPERIVIHSPLSRSVSITRSEVGLFHVLYIGKSRSVVARMQKEHERLSDVRRRLEPSDVVIPKDIMPPDELVRRLEAWRTSQSTHSQ